MYPEKHRPSDNWKAPKLRFHPGNFVRNNKTGDLFCVTLAYRLITEPNVWLFELEIRQNLNNPSNPLSIACETVGEKPNPSRIIYEPLRDTSDNRYINRTRNDFHFGDSITSTTRELLNDYTLVSSGEISATQIVKGQPNR